MVDGKGFFVGTQSIEISNIGQLPQWLTSHSRWDSTRVRGLSTECRHRVGIAASAAGPARLQCGGRDGLTRTYVR